MFKSCWIEPFTTRSKGQERIWLHGQKQQSQPLYEFQLRWQQNVWDMRAHRLVGVAVPVVDGTCHNLVVINRWPCKIQRPSNKACMCVRVKWTYNQPALHNSPMESNEQLWKPRTRCTCLASGRSTGRSSSAS